MYAPYPENMMESIKKVEATRAQRMATEPRRLTAEEKDALLEKFHPDYNPDAFAEIKVGPNKGQKAPLELAEMLHSTSRLINEKIDLTKIDYDVDVLVIGGGGAGSSCAIEAHNAGADVMIVTKLRIGDANTMMAEGGIQAADKENDSPVQHYLDCFGGGHFAAKPELVKRLVMEAPDAIKWLNDLGVEFDKAESVIYKIFQRFFCFKVSRFRIVRQISGFPSQNSCNCTVSKQFFCTIYQLLHLKSSNLTFLPSEWIFSTNSFIVWENFTPSAAETHSTLVLPFSTPI